jgi:hypothetical protein
LVALEQRPYLTAHVLLGEPFQTNLCQGFAELGNYLFTTEKKKQNEN